ncbi:MAG: DUF1080 domain-containing protein, partial [Planctomycetaceae bacterium]|nr:DUF1080 domain-containing protein [Planctomycetaceae bacterium]
MKALISTWIRVLGLVVILVTASCSQNPAPAPTADEMAEVASEEMAETTATDDSLVVDEFHNPLSAEQISEGWISLFDGETLYGWVSNEDSVNWHVADGCITSDTGEKGLLHTSVPFADYELTCDFRFDPGGNSGLFLRTKHIPENAQTDCYELNLADAHPTGHTTGSYVDLK